MANEISITVRVEVKKGNFSDLFNSGRKTFDQAGDGGGNPGVVALTTSEVNIDFGDITPGYVVMQNLDDTNSVNLGQDDAGTMKTIGEIEPGGFAMFKLATGQTLRMAAATGTADVLVKGYDA